MKGPAKGLVVVLVISLLLARVPVQAQEQRVCLPRSEVMLLANERKGIEPGLARAFSRVLPEDRGATWRYTRLSAEDLFEACVERVDPRALRVDGVLYQWVGLQESGHWYRILSVAEEGAALPMREDVYGVFPREPRRVKVVMDTADDFRGSVEMFRFMAPIRVTRWGVHDESVAWVRDQRYQFAFVIPATRRVMLIPTCARRAVQAQPDCHFPVTVFDLSASLKYHPLILSFIEDQGFWESIVR
jgi:hypothetical protein